MIALNSKNGSRTGKSPKFGARNAEDILDEAEEDDEGSIRESDENQRDQSLQDDSESQQSNQQSNRNAKSSIGNGTGKQSFKNEIETQNDAMFVLNTGSNNAPPIEEEKKQSVYKAEGATAFTLKAGDSP